MAVAAIPYWAQDAQLRKYETILRDTKRVPHDEDIATLSVICSFLEHLRVRSDVDYSSPRLLGPVVISEFNHYVLRYVLPPTGPHVNPAEMDDLRRVLNLNDLFRNEPIVYVAWQVDREGAKLVVHVLMAKVSYDLSGLHPQTQAIAGEAARPPPRRSPRSARRPYASADAMISSLGGAYSALTMAALAAGYGNGLAAMHTKIKTDFPTLNHFDIDALEVAATALVHCVVQHTCWKCSQCCPSTQEGDAIVDLAHVLEAHEIELATNITDSYHEVIAYTKKITLDWEHAVALVDATQKTGGIMWLSVGLPDATVSEPPPPTVAFPGTAGTPVQAKVVRPYMSIGLPKARHCLEFLTKCTRSCSIDLHPDGNSCRCPMCIQQVSISRWPRVRDAMNIRKGVVMAIPHRAPSEHPIARHFYENHKYGVGGSEVG
jgi:hypothetical protein